MEQKIKYECMTLKDKVIITATLKLLKHFRGLEQAGILPEAAAASFIGCVKKLSAIAKGEEVSAKVG